VDKERILKLLGGLKTEHYYFNSAALCRAHPRYKPDHRDGDSDPMTCTCGADRKNKTIDEIIELIHNG
jgi:hypothetical protein